MKTLRKIIGLMAVFAMLYGSCSKSAFLDVKPDESMAVPYTLAHFTAMMDNDAIVNGAGGSSPLYPALPDLASDDAWVPDARFHSNLPEMQRAVYTWAPNPYPATDMNEWSRPYGIILNCNVVLEGLEKIRQEQKDMVAWNTTKGMALFNRSHAYAMLLYMFAPVYERANAARQYGVPLRMTADLSEKIVYASLEDCYQRILYDLKEAVDLLPMDPLYKTRASKRSCWALLARIYLWMSDYEQSNHYAGLCLEANDDLLDYNTYPTNVTYPFPRFNAEVIFNCNMSNAYSSQMRVNPDLYETYDDDDLRRVLFYKAQGNDGYRFYGNYDGTTYVFSGLANDEVYLTRAETYTRIGEVQLAMDDLNTLLRTRYRTIDGETTFVPYAVTDKEEAMALILEERRKQLVWRGLRWMDLKRLNLDPVYAKVLTRKIGDDTYELRPGDPRYVFPVPDPVVDINPNLKR